MTQWVIVAVVVGLSVIYLAYRLWRAIGAANDPCRGCEGCALRDEMRQRRGTKHKKTRCDKKNKPKNLVVL